MDVKGASRGRSEGGLMDADRICFSCDKIFANRKFLEEHMCPSANYICSCGTEFSNYPDMLYHSTTHQTGHQMLHHQTIKKRRIEKNLEVEEKLKRLESGDVVWKVPESGNVSSSNEKISLKSAQMHNLDLTVSENLKPEPSVKNVFGVGAPTVDLWTLYQPVVVVHKESNSVLNKPFICGKCGEAFLTKNALVFHSSSHFTDKISGCIGCGLLLCSKKQMPRFHVCNSSSRSSKLRLITARPLNQQNLLVGSPGGKRPSPAPKNSPTAQVNSIPLAKNQYLGAYSKKGQGPQVSSSPQLKNQTPAKPYTDSLLTKKTSLSPNTQPGICPSPTKQLSMSTSTSVQFKPWPPSSGANGFNCKVCHSPFESAHLLQRHKCPKAKEFMARQMQAGKRPYKINEAKVSSPSIFPAKKDRKPVPPANGDVMKGPVAVVNLDDDADVIPIKVTVGSDVEDDCYIIESGEDKPAEMIYQVTSSVPIKT